MAHSTLKFIIVILGLIAIPFHLLSGTGQTPTTILTFTEGFIENNGQWSDEVLFFVRRNGLDTWILRDGMMLDIYKTVPNDTRNSTSHLFSKARNEGGIRSGERIRLRLLEANKYPFVTGVQPASGYYNYFIGRNKGKHGTTVKSYKEVLLKNVYPGIDMRYYFENGHVRYDYIVQPFADPGMIRFCLDGVEKVQIHDHQELLLKTKYGELAIKDLLVYTENGPVVESAFIKNGDEIHIETSSYNSGRTLIIDPLLFSTYLGGSVDDVCTASAVDIAGNIYITGYTWSVDFDITTGAYQTILTGLGNVFIAKLNQTGNNLEYATFLGGSNREEAKAIAIDSAGNAYVTGYTWSADFDITAGAFQPAISSDGWDAFVTKLNPSGTGLLYSTYLGGNGVESAEALQLDATGAAIITGYTASTDFNVTQGCLQPLYAGGTSDIFLTKLNAGGTGLLYSTYLGGTADDVAMDVSQDNNGHYYLTGYTGSSDFIITSGAFQTIYNGGLWDAFVSHLDAAGAALLYSTYIGGVNQDFGSSLAVNSAGEVYLTGSTSSGDLPVTVGAFQTTHGGGYDDAFLLHLNAGGSSLIYSTFLGADDMDEGIALKVDNAGNAIVSGETTSLFFPVTSGAVQSTFQGGVSDAFVSQVNPSGSALLYSTYLGGFNQDYSNSITIDTAGNYFVTGMTISPDFYVTSGVYQPVFGGAGLDYGDAFICKFSNTVSTPLSDITKKTSTIKVFPNPASDMIYIEFSDESFAKEQIRITSSDGRIVASLNQTSQQGSFDISQLSTGYYILQTSGSNGLTERTGFIKQ